MDSAFREKIIDVYKLLVSRSDVTAALDAYDLMLKHVKDFLRITNMGYTVHS